MLKTLWHVFVYIGLYRVKANTSTSAHFNVDATQFTPVPYTINATAYSSTDIYNYFLILGFHTQLPLRLPRHNAKEQSTS